jgi:hypothetical protein
MADITTARLGVYPRETIDHRSIECFKSHYIPVPKKFSPKLSSPNLHPVYIYKWIKNDEGHFMWYGIDEVGEPRSGPISMVKIFFQLQALHCLLCRPYSIP